MECRSLNPFLALSLVCQLPQMAAQAQSQEEESPCVSQTMIRSERKHIASRGVVASTKIHAIHGVTTSLSRRSACGSDAASTARPVDCSSHVLVLVVIGELRVRGSYQKWGTVYLLNRASIRTCCTAHPCPPLHRSCWTSCTNYIRESLI